MNNRNELGTYLTSLGLVNKGVEVGTFKGNFSKTILSAWSGTLYMVDPWRELTEGYIDSSNHSNHPNAYLDTINNIKGFEDRAIMIRTLSEQAVNLFEDESLDFVYIDGNHAYNYVKQDIELWYPKVKKGGIISGHDYLKLNWYNDPHWVDNSKKDKHIYLNNSYAGIFGVNTAVDEFCNKNNYQFQTDNEFLGTWYFTKK